MNVKKTQHKVKCLIPLNLFDFLTLVYADRLIEPVHKHA